MEGENGAPGRDCSPGSAWIISDRLLLLVFGFVVLVWGKGVEAQVPLVVFPREDAVLVVVQIISQLPTRRSCLSAFVDVGTRGVTHFLFFFLSLSLINPP